MIKHLGRLTRMVARASPLEKWSFSWRASPTTSRRRILRRYSTIWTKAGIEVWILKNLRLCFLHRFAFYYFNFMLDHFVPQTVAKHLCLFDCSLYNIVIHILFNDTFSVGDVGGVRQWMVKNWRGRIGKDYLIDQFFSTKSFFSSVKYVSKITYSYMRKIIDQVGAEGVTDDEIRQIFNMIDKDKSGKLSLRVTITPFGWW